MRFGIFLVHRGVISAEQLVEAIEEQINQQPALGQVAIEEGELSPREVFAILRAQADSAKERFGDAAMELGLLSRDQVARLLMQQADRVAPLQEVLVTLGFAEWETIDQELAAYRRNMERSGARRGDTLGGPQAARRLEAADGDLLLAR